MISENFTCIEDISNRVCQLNSNLFPTVSHQNSILNIFIESEERYNIQTMLNRIDDIVKEYYFFINRHVYYNNDRNTLNIRYKLE